jgi:hypothetical protein
VGFPEDQIFCPLLADPKEARSFMSFLRGTFRSLDDPSGEGTSIASVGIGDSFGLVRFGGPDAGEGVQLDVVGSIFAQFDMGAPSNDLINADYIIGVPLTFRRRGFSLRAKLYHQSSHLGDEYLLRDEEIVRENLSFESVELLVSQELGALRAYVGGERIFRREPDTLPDSLFHTGVEFRTGRARKVQLLAGVDLKTTELHDWSPGVSARVGMEVGRRDPKDIPDDSSCCWWSTTRGRRRTASSFRTTSHTSALAFTSDSDGMSAPHGDARCATRRDFLTAAAGATAGILVSGQCFAAPGTDDAGASRRDLGRALVQLQPGQGFLRCARPTGQSRHRA